MINSVFVNLNGADINVLNIEYLTGVIQYNFKENIQSIMENRKDGDKLMWKWVTEVNPNANFNEVSEMFQHMQSLYLEKRSSIIAINKVLFELEKRDANLRTMFPSNMIINIVGETEPLVRK